ncbi:cardiolipin synthase [Paracoccus aerodenitrificans]|uniref:cardiolipin synthase n=1 Tax=Paracoccus aerodenitrificans TaxID=3017781 RepID=UPI0022EFFCAC|nr:cardiolipin synthase [Paracoccus aerodenitrificans]WBU62992.1 cardiolipin synthase [Paracoccus aerodenitrificans]
MWTSLLAFTHYFLALLVVLRVLTRSRMEPSVRVAWIIVVESLPVVGILAYLLFGEVRIAQAERQRSADVRQRLTGMWVPSPNAVTDPPDWIAGIVGSVRAVGGMDPVSGNRFDLLDEGDNAFDRMIDAIDSAQDHVHVLFYIWLDDTSGRRVAEALIRAAERGVACRIVVDAFGSRSFIRSAIWNAMENAGIETVQAMPTGISLFRALTRRLDLRNHRKIVLVDHRIGFTGSRNAADMAFSAKPKYAPWIDVWFSIEGPVLRQMQAVFLADWMSYTGSDLGTELLNTVPAVEKPGVIAQALATGPDRRQGSVSDCITAMLAAARKNVVITTPYYVPTTALDNALQACARRGVDVTLILPARNDSLFVEASSEGFYLGLLRAGVRIMQFKGGLLHSKLATVDGRVAMIGSGNLDRRSFELNYEMNLLVSGEGIIDRIDERQKTYIARARELTLAEVEAWPVWRKIRNNTLSLATPLL